MADDNQPELDAETLRKIEEDIQAQFAEHEPVLDEETLKQIEAQVAAEFDGNAVSPAPEAPNIDPVQELHQQATDLDMSIGMDQQAPQFAEPQISAQPINEQVPVYEQPQLQHTQYEQPPVYEQPQAQEPQYEQAPVYEQPQEQLYEEQVVPQAPQAPSAKANTGGKKKRKLKAGSKTRVSMAGAKSPSSRARQTRVPDEEEMEFEEEAPRNTRSAGRRTGRRKVEEEPKKSKTGLIIGIILGVAAIAAVVVFIVINNKNKAKDENKVVETEEKKEEVAEKKEPPKPRLPSTGALNAQDFRTQVLSMIHGGKLEQAELYIRARKNDAPDEDLSYLEKQLKRKQEK